MAVSMNGQVPSQPLDHYFSLSANEVQSSFFAMYEASDRLSALLRLRSV
jgi:hypothetical protein